MAPVVSVAKTLVFAAGGNRMANGNKPLAADPYAHQPDGEWKIERQQSDRQLLAQVLGIPEGEIYERSRQFVGREVKFFQFLFAMRFLSRASRFELTENATILRICALIFAIEGITPGRPSKRLSRFLVKYLARDHKLALLRGFTFTPEYALGANREADRHLMFESAIADNAFREANVLDCIPEFCSTGERPICFCLEWLAEQSEEVLNRFVRELGDKLYQMRCAVVHDGTPVVFGEAEENRPANVVQWSVSLVDAFSRGRGRFVTYESGILVRDFSAMLMRAIRQCFEDGARF